MAMDQSQIRCSLERLKLNTPSEVFAILEKYYPRGQIKPATRYFVEELFQS